MNRMHRKTCREIQNQTHTGQQIGRANGNAERKWIATAIGDLKRRRMEWNGMEVGGEGRSGGGVGGESREH